MIGQEAKTPSGIYDLGLVISTQLVAAGDDLSWVEQLVLLVIAGVVVLLCTYIAALMVQVLVAGWFVGFGGVFILGFGGAKWTSDMAVNYYRACLGIGLQGMSMVLLVGSGQSMIQALVQRASAAITLHEAQVLLSMVFLFWVLIDKVPPQVASLATGGGLQHGFSNLSPLGARYMSFAMASAWRTAWRDSAGRGSSRGERGASPAGLGAGELGGPSGAGQQQTMTDTAARDYIQNAFEPSGGGSSAAEAGPVDGEQAQESGDGVGSVYAASNEDSAMDSAVRNGTTHEADAEEWSSVDDEELQELASETSDEVLSEREGVRDYEVDSGDGPDPWGWGGTEVEPQSKPGRQGRHAGFAAADDAKVEASGNVRGDAVFNGAEGVQFGSSPTRDGESAAGAWASVAESSRSGANRPNEKRGGVSRAGLHEFGTSSDHQGAGSGRSEKDQPNNGLHGRRGGRVTSDPHAKVAPMSQAEFREHLKKWKGVDAWQRVNRSGRPRNAEFEKRRDYLNPEEDGRPHGNGVPPEDDS